MTTEFSNVTKNYLCRFYQILDEMIEGMESAPLTDSISHNFIVQMIPHHRAAIEMSRNLLLYTTCVPLQRIAGGIVETQTKGIADMQAALCGCSQLASTEQERCLYARRLKQITRTMFSEMSDACASNDINVSFMREMLPHHRGAIRMAENALRFPICPALTPILREIIVSQRAGVRGMERLLRCM